MFTYTFFAENSTLSSAGITFTTEPSTLKLEVTISAWNFRQPTNTLRLHLGLDVIPNITDQQINMDPNITTITISSLNMMPSINLLTKGVADGHNTVLSHWDLRVMEGVEILSSWLSCLCCSSLQCSSLLLW